MERTPYLTVAVLAGAALLAAPADAGRRDRNDVSPVRGIERDRQRDGDRHRDGRRRPSADFRAIDGSANNEGHEAWGAAGTALLRLMPPDYADAVSAMAGAGRASPREVSNAVAAQAAPIGNPLGTSDYLWQWGQFVDHDVDLTDGVAPPEPAPIPVPLGDPFFDPFGTGSATIAFNRSIYDPATGVSPDAPRQQMNEITAFIDASNVYGSDEERAAALRTLDGTGRLATSAGDLLPFNTAGLPNAGGSGPELFLAGDVRANEQAALTALHTLFVREHNRLVAGLAARLYEKARQLVGAQLQAITYREFLPALLGRDALPPYRGYDPELDPGIANTFSTAAYRFGHSALSPTLLRLNGRGREIREGHLPLRDAFFAPQVIIEQGGIEPLLRGLAAQRHQRIDVQVVDDVRNFLFGPPGAGGFDLAALNIQRGRDHGLPGYNDAREAMGLPRAASFAEMSSDLEVQARLAAVYASPDDVDLWVGCLAEDPVRGSHLGPLAHRIVVDQFVALRDGDRYWYEKTLSRSERDEVEATRLSDVIRRNTSIGRELSGDVFHVGRRR